MTRDGFVETGDVSIFDPPHEFADLKLTLRRGRDLTSRFSVFLPPWSRNENISAIYSDKFVLLPGLPGDDRFPLIAVSS